MEQDSMSEGHSGTEARFIPKGQSRNPSALPGK